MGVFRYCVFVGCLLMPLRFECCNAAGLFIDYVGLVLG